MNSILFGQLVSSGLGQFGAKATNSGAKSATAVTVSTNVGRHCRFWGDVGRNRRVSENKRILVSPLLGPNRAKSTNAGAMLTDSGRKRQTLQRFRPTFEGDQSWSGVDQFQPSLPNFGADVEENCPPVKNSVAWSAPPRPPTVMESRGDRIHLRNLLSSRAPAMVFSWADAASLQTLVTSILHSNTPKAGGASGGGILKTYFPCSGASGGGRRKRRRKLYATPLD